jgi:peptide/nickel transport system permease protein
MLFFLLRRLLASLVVLLVSSFLVFSLCAASFDPLAKFRQRQPPPSQQLLDTEAHRLGIDRPFFERYWNWLTGVLHGDFGNTIGNTPVSEQLWARVAVTGRMIIFAVILAILLAVVVGVVGAVRQYTFADYATTTLAYVLIALPTFWFATLLKQYLAVELNKLFGTNVLETIGEQSAGIQLTADSAWALWQDRLAHLVLPTISLALLSFASWSRFQRASMLDVLGSDYMRLARAKGLTFRRTVWKHGLRNALIPLTTVVALGTGTLFGGAIITEQVFAWNGMGRYLLQDGIGNNDINVVLAWLLVSAVFVILFNLVADLLYAVLDPRIRLS